MPATGLKLLQGEDQSDWNTFCQQRIEQGYGGQSLPLKTYLDHLARLKECEVDGRKRDVLEQLERYIRMHLHSLHIVVDGG